MSDLRGNLRLFALGASTSSRVTSCEPNGQHRRGASRETLFSQNLKNQKRGGPIHSTQCQNRISTRLRKKIGFILISHRDQK